MARAACTAARRAPSAGGAAVFDELSGHFRLLDGLDEKALADIVQRTFAPLLDYDAHHRASLYETLYTLFDHHLAVQETADVLHIHRNTLQRKMVEYGLGERRVRTRRKPMAREGRLRKRKTGAA